MTTLSSPRPPLAVTPAKLAAESLPGYVLRLAEANRMEKVEWLPLTPKHQGTQSFAHAVAGDQRALAALEHLACAEPGSLVREVWRPMESAAGPYIGVWGEALPADAFMTSGAQVCPRCLEEPLPFLHADWDLSLVTVCSAHRIQLVDDCPSCGAPLRWSRPKMVVCGRCAADLRRARSMACTDEEVVLADFSAAVARFVFQGKVDSLEPPEALLEIGRLLSLNRSDFLDERQQRHFARLPLTARTEAARRLASCIVERKVSGDRVHRLLLERVSHIQALLGETRARSRLYRFLSSNDFLSLSVKRYLAYTVYDAEPMRAAEQFEGRPPRLFTLAQAKAFVGCTDEEFKLAIAEGLVHRPSRGHAFDADHLLDMQRRLRSLLSEADIDRSFGVAGLCNALLKLRVIRSDRRAGLPTAVSVETYEAVLDRLVQASESRQHRAASEAVVLGERIDSMDAGALACLISRVNSGGVRVFSWCAPWGWRQMAVDVKTWERLEEEWPACASRSS